MKQNYSIIKQMTNLSERIIPICDPLNALGIHTFTVLINYIDGTQVNLSNKPTWIDDYYTLELYNSSFYDNKPDLFHSGYNLWSARSNLPVFHYGLQRYDSGQGITIIHRHPHNTSFYFFSGSNQNTQLYNFIINNLMFFERFIQYFLQQSSNTLKKAYSLNLQRQISEKKLVDIKTVTHSLNEYQNLCQIKHSIEEKFDFISKSNLSPELSLSPRQKQVLYWSMHGKSAKETAKILGISPRTVERHFEILREKTSTSNKQELTFKTVIKTTEEDWLLQ
ncbi:helix-turn-helix transcriptional regulator [Legionella cincinnatiensis]|uniref:Transcription regulator protein, response regulator containing CheY-like receiver domain and HTH DNA-binding domain n=1 Tax=Legionella cincinnatiensis TaxID=28085 RepID=A0A378IGW9_9GAMM|nr:helix-turn-helix transcriptional regulator [Legionella cincinnatiensis]KTC83553.1 hypothetical protein Lcin_2240 [Legionella cincinnatiensis]STX34488.1 transcription regulator protein, response regulator containing CheY-like receiver domain and HTH DNA-binding domain [Legionella cincinnatiensis]